MPDPVIRYHALDSLRAVAMFLGILLHAVIPFCQAKVPFWCVHEQRTSIVADLFLFGVHNFRMHLFFLLAGFFTALLYQRYGLKKMLKQRAVRIGIPFVVGVLTLQPLMQYIWMHGDLAALAYISGGAVDISPGRDALIAEHFGEGKFLKWITPFHLWFLYFLLWFYTAMILLIPLGTKLMATRIGRGILSAFRRVMTSRFRWVILAVVTGPLLIPMQLNVADTPHNWGPDWHILGYYFCFFLIGWGLWYERELLPEFVRHWKLALLLGNLLMLPILLASIAPLIAHIRGETTLPESVVLSLRAGIIFFGGMYTWMMITGLMGLFMCCFAGESKTMRYLADASYWCYVLSLPPLVLLQLWVVDWQINGFVKFLFINLMAIIVLLLSYEYLVRYTLIGRVMNGPKTRAARG